MGKRDSEIIELGDIRYEYALLSAQLDLIKVDPQFLLASGAQDCRIPRCFLLSMKCFRASLFGDFNCGETGPSKPIQHCHSSSPCTERGHD